MKPSDMMHSDHHVFRDTPGQVLTSERKGFEPLVPFRYTSLAGKHFRPLSHLSINEVFLLPGKTLEEKEEEGSTHMEDPIHPTRFWGIKGWT